MVYCYGYDPAWHVPWRALELVDFRSKEPQLIDGKPFVVKQSSTLMKNDKSSDLLNRKNVSKPDSRVKNSDEPMKGECHLAELILKINVGFPGWLGVIL